MSGFAGTSRLDFSAAPGVTGEVRRPLLAIGLLVAAAGSARAQAAPDPVAGLPLLAELGDGPTPVRVRGRLPAKQAVAMVALARAVYADVNRRFVAPTRRRHLPVDLCLFASRRDYDAFTDQVFGGAESELGFYDPGPRVAVVNLQYGAGNLRHELAHPLLGDDFAAIPAWINEGIGSLYGTAVAGRAGRFRFLVNYRLRDVQRAIRERSLPTLDQLVDSDDDDVRGDRAATYYGLSRYLLLYLEEHGQLERFYREVRDRGADPARQQALLERLVDYDRFVAWARRLRYRR